MIVANRNNHRVKQLAEFMALQYEEKITPLEKIILDERLNVFYDSYEDAFDGMTIYDKGKFYIHLNTDRGNRNNSEKGRFTLAHEFGHYFIDAHRIGLKKGLLEAHPSEPNKKQYLAIEREADYFASCLLMPEIRFCKDIAGKKFNAQIIDLLKTEYKVSRTACALRFADIGNCPIMVVYAENSRVKWTHSSDDFRYKYFINDKIVPRNTVMGDYFYNNSKIDTYKTETIFAIDCFNHVRDEDIRKLFYEYCITYQNSALSIIWED
jgi:Zn-dependent peptidase ImmA (M78 family)